MNHPNVFILCKLFLVSIVVHKVELKLLGLSSGLGSALEVSIVAISAALYAVFFFLSYLISVPTFTILYLPVILLGVFPVWFGLSGLFGSMIGAVIGGLFVENLADCLSFYGDLCF